MEKLEINALTGNCITCQKILRGRTDKKFCNDYCRNNYNNRLKAPANNLVRHINNALGKNRRILENYYKEGKAVKITMVELLHCGFQFSYFTHQAINKQGLTCFFCYDYGYLPLKNNCFFLLKKEKMSAHNFQLFLACKTNSSLS